MKERWNLCVCLMDHRLMHLQHLQQQQYQFEKNVRSWKLVSKNILCYFLCALVEISFVRRAKLQLTCVNFVILARVAAKLTTDSR